MNDQKRTYDLYLEIFEIMEEYVRQVKRCALLPQLCTDYILFSREKDLLKYIGDHLGCTITELANQFCVTKSTMSHNIKNLRERGLTYSVVNEYDAKIYHIFLTEDGATVVKFINDRLEEEFEIGYSFVEQFTAEEMELCNTILRAFTRATEKAVDEKAEKAETLKKKGYR